MILNIIISKLVIYILGQSCTKEGARGVNAQNAKVMKEPQSAIQFQNNCINFNINLFVFHFYQYNIVIMLK